jgi:hypothetical protein
MTRNDAADLLSRRMPGWRLAAPVDEPNFTADEVRDMKVDSGPSIAALRQKFLDSSQDAVRSAEVEFAPIDSTRETVRIEPERGGQAKTADVSDDGEIKIVQG